MATWVCASCGGENPEGMRFCGHCGSAAEATAAPSPPQPEADAADALRSFVTGQVADQLVEAGGKLTEERRLVTALFADISGFTSLAERLDPEQLLEVIDPVVSALSNVVGRYEGFVEKFAGDALLALFGAPVSHEDDAERALLVAMEMHRELAGMRDDLPWDATGLTLHVGVNSGHGIARMIGSEVRMDYAVLGDSVILAQRLESAAPANETYVGETTYRLARGRFELEPVGELTLKGKAEPVPAWRLVGERAHEAHAQPEAGRPQLVGRKAELAALNGALDALAAGKGGIVELTGEPGVGKSRLTDAMREQALARGVRWLETRCLSYGAGLPYWPFAELLRLTAGIRGDATPRDALARLEQITEAVQETRPFFARLLALPGDSDVAGLEPEAFRRGLHDAFVCWSGALAREGPVALAVEDVHWADASSLALTAELAHAPESTSLLLYLTGRPEAAEKLESLAGASLTRLPLAPLDPSATEELVAEVLNADPPPVLVKLVRERTGGNPFFVEELVHSLQESEALTRSNGGWRLKRGWDANDLPPTVEGVLSARMDMLPRTAASLLQSASVIGRRVPVALLAAVANGQLDQLERLTAAGFLDRAPDTEEVLVFRHALVQDAAYARLLRRQKRDLHRRIADIAEALYGSGDDVVDLLARHLYLGEAGAKAVDYLERAGNRAEQLFANDEAILHFERAVEVARAEAQLSERVPELMLELAELRELTGDYGAALELYEDVRAGTLDVRAWAGKAAVLRRQGSYNESLKVVDDAFRTDELKGADLTRLWLERGATLCVADRFDQAIDVLEAGLETTHSADAPIVGQLLLQLTRAETITGRFDEALRHGLRAREIFETHDDLHSTATALRIIGDVHRQRGELAEAAAALQKGLDIAQRTGNAEEIGGCLINLGIVQMKDGAPVEAVASLQEAVDLFERVDHGSGRAIGYSALADALVHAGRYAEALEFCNKALDVAREIDHPLTIAEATQVIASISLHQGDYAAAAAKAEEAVRIYLDVGAEPLAVEPLEIAAEAYERAGDGERARDLYARARSSAIS